MMKPLKLCDKIKLSLSTTDETISFSRYSDETISSKHTSITSNFENYGNNLEKYI